MPASETTRTSSYLKQSNHLRPTNAQQAIIDGTFTPDMVDLEHIPPAKRGWTIDRIKESVQGLWGIAQNIRRKRYERGALSLNQGKLWFDFENGNSNMAPKGWYVGS